MITTLHTTTTKHANHTSLECKTKHIYPAYNGSTKKHYNGYQLYRISQTAAEHFPDEYPLFFTFSQCKKLGGKVKKGSKSKTQSYYFVDKEITPKPTDKTGKPRRETKQRRNVALFHLSQCTFPDDIYEGLYDFIDRLERCLVETFVAKTLHLDESLFNRCLISLIASNSLDMLTKPVFDSIPCVIKEQLWPYLYGELNPLSTH
jgi:hypothetical protein